MAQPFVQLSKPAQALARPWRIRAASLHRPDALRADCIAGLTVAAISLPQSIAYALIAGVDPRFGLYTAIIFTAVAGVLGSSRHLVNGPTGAVSLVTFGALAFIEPDARLDAYEALFLLATLVGLIQVAVAVFRLGDLTRYVSESVVTGFIAGAALLTIIGQLANALGMKAIGSGHQHVLLRLWLTLTQAAPPNPRALFISLLSIGLALLGRRLVRRYRLPQLDMLLVLMAVSLLAWLAGWSTPLPGEKPAIALIEAVPASLPHLHIPEIHWHWVLDLSSSAFAIAMLGLLEALAIAKAIAYKTQETLDYNRQCIAEGLGNLAGGLFSCMPGSGSLSRTAINYQAGAVTRFSGVFAAAVVAVVVLALGPATALIPKAALAGLLIVASARLIDVPRLRYILGSSRYDAGLLLVTAAAALVVGVEFAILIGVVLSTFWYLPKAAKLRATELVVTPEGLVRARVVGDPPSRDVLILDLEGELFFGAGPVLEGHLENALALARRQQIRYLVLRLKRVRNPDVVTIEVLEKFLQQAHAVGVTILLAGLRADLIASLARVGIDGRQPQVRIYPENDEEYSATLAAVRMALSLFRASQEPAAATRDCEAYRI